MLEGMQKVLTPGAQNPFINACHAIIIWLGTSNIPYENINAIGKQWIRKYALAVCKEMLGQIRGKFTTIPIPGESVTLNHADLLAQAKEEQQNLKDKLVEMLKEVEYKELVKYDSETAEASEKVFKGSPLPIFVG